MPSSDQFPEADLARLVERFGLDVVRSHLANIEEKEDRVLSVIVNDGMHAIPAHLLRGDVYTFSSGHVNLDRDSAEDSLKGLIKQGHKYLTSSNWNKVYIIPSGHPLLVVVATLLVFRSIRVDPIVVSYFGSDGYADINTNIREVIFGVS